MPDIEILSVHQSAHAGLMTMKYLGPVIGTNSEKGNGVRDEKIERDQALKRLMSQAEQLGATHVVIYAICRPQWEYVVITGDAYQARPATPEEHEMNELMRAASPSQRTA